MSDLTGSADARETSGVKRDFFGEVVASEVNSQRERFQTQYDSDYDVFMEIEPLTEYGNRQYVLGLDVSESWGSKWQVMVAHIENIHGPFSELGLASLEDLADFLVGRVYAFREIDFGSDYEVEWQHAPNGGETRAVTELFPDEEYRPDPLTVPAMEVTDPAQLADLGADQDGNVEEVDF